MEVCVIASGSSGNCVYVGTERAKVLIDAGIPARRIEAALREFDIDPASLDAVLVTHEHSDHISGIGPVARRHKVPVYANELTWRAIGQSIGELPTGLARPFPAAGLELGDLWVESFSTMHDAADPVGYTFTDGRDKVGLMTDTGVVPETAYERLAGAAALIFETNHDEEMLVHGGYPAWLKKRILGNRGHLSNETAAAALVKMLDSCAKGATRVFLAHLSKENNTPSLAYAAVKEALLAAGIGPGTDVDLVLTARDRTTPLYKVG